MTEPNLPVHVILGAADIQRIKTTEPAVLGKNPDTDPGAEFTMLGWTITGKSMVSGTETEKGFFLKSSHDEFKQMCSQEVLGLTDEPNVQGLFHEDFKNQLQRLDDGTYPTRLPWKSQRPAHLPVNKGLTLKRLPSTTGKLERMGKLDEYHTIMAQQLEEGILELVPEVPTGKVNSTYAKLTVGTQPHESKILGVPWNKEEDTFSINFAKTLKGVEEGPLTKRKMLSAINSIFDLLGIAAPVVIVGKVLYSKVCLRKLRWDEEVPVDIQKPWTKWLNDMKECPYVSIPRSVVGVSLTGAILHGFSDASKLVVSVAVYAVTTHIAAPLQQRLLVAKSRIAPKDQ